MNPILMYHYIGTPPPPGAPHRGLTVPRDEFARQLDILLAAGRACVTGREYSDALARGDGRRSAWITFDDGRIDNYTDAFPELAARKLRATFFVVCDWALSGKSEHMNLAQLKELAVAGMEIGCHSASHPHLARIDVASLREEIEVPKKKLEDALGTEVTSFCYPYGNWNDQVIAAVRSAGYQLAVSTIRDNRNTEKDRWKLKRVMVQPGRSRWGFRYLFSPLYHAVHERKNRRRWKEQKGGDE